MRVTQEKSVFQLAFLPNVFPVNCYLVEEKDGLTLIDAAMPFSAKRILETAEAIGKPITRIALTHAHDDHIGALDVLKMALPDAVVHISARDARLLAGDRSLLPGEPDTPIRGGVPKPGKIKTRPDVLLNDGDAIGSLVAVAAPGHTPGSMAFLDTRTNALIAGDAWQIRGGMAVSGQVQMLFPFPAMATWNKRIALQSARKLTGLRPSLLAVGHGSLLADPEAAMQRTIAAAEKHFQQMSK